MIGRFVRCTITVVLPLYARIAMALIRVLGFLGILEGVVLSNIASPLN